MAIYKLLFVVLFVALAYVTAKDAIKSVKNTSEEKEVEIVAVRVEVSAAKEIDAVVSQHWNIGTLFGIILWLSVKKWRECCSSSVSCFGLTCCGIKLGGGCVAIETIITQYCCIYKTK